MNFILEETRRKKNNKKKKKIIKRKEVRAKKRRKKKNERKETKKRISIVKTFAYLSLFLEENILICYRLVCPPSKYDHGGAFPRIRTIDNRELVCQAVSYD